MKKKTMAHGHLEVEKRTLTLFVFYGAWGNLNSFLVEGDRFGDAIKAFCRVIYAHAL